ncbi:ankyrin repeat domain-containing protein, partial [Sphingomonas sp.]|uniref:ankyrin repeat domain-containing protein n=1 Tax=Sphingomonas sp. TaxID=28214 RepID=UPI00289BA4BB
VLASYNGHLSTTALLLDAGARPEGATDAQGNSALMGVAFKGHADIARLLVARGADVNYRNRAGQTAAMMATLFRQEAILDLLIAHGADLSIADTSGNTARTLAMMQGNAALAERLS